MSGRIAIATRLGFREQARRPLLLVLLVVLPFFFITPASANTEAIPRQIGLPGGGTVLTTMREIHGATMAAITVAFLAGLCGAFVMRSARQADRRLVVAGYRPI
jgi:ABC-2 type transport system permease protein